MLGFRTVNLRGQDHAPAAGHAVIVADGNHESLALLEMAVESWGCRPVGAGDGDEALELCRRLAPAVVILDLELPKQGGRAVLRAVRSLDPRAVVVLVSGSGSLRDAKLAMREGAADFLTKPLDYGRLRDLVQNAVSARRTLPPRAPGVVL